MLLTVLKTWFLWQGLIILTLWHVLNEKKTEPFQGQKISLFSTSLCISTDTTLCQICGRLYNSLYDAHQFHSKYLAYIKMVIHNPKCLLQDCNKLLRQKCVHLTQKLYLRQSQCQAQYCHFCKLLLLYAFNCPRSNHNMGTSFATKGHQVYYMMTKL